SECCHGAISSRRWRMARRRIGAADIKAALVAGDAGQRVSAIARMLGYTRPTVRKYLAAAQRPRSATGAAARRGLAWERAPRRVHHGRAGVATQEVAAQHA